MFYDKVGYIFYEIFVLLFAFNLNVKQRFWKPKQEFLYRSGLWGNKCWKSGLIVRSDQPATKNISGIINEKSADVKWYMYNSTSVDDNTVDGSLC